MPNWKKVLTSGSAGELLSLYAPSITGSLLGTASYALSSSASSLNNVLIVGNTTGNNNIIFNNEYGIFGGLTSSVNYNFVKFKSDRLLLYAWDGVNPKSQLTLWKTGIIDIAGGDQTVVSGINGVDLQSNGYISNVSDLFIITSSYVGVYGSSLTFSGIQYDTDYSANYTNRSLVDKEYVDTHSGGSVNTGSLLTTASFSNPNLTFTKGNGSTFGVNLNTLQPTTASYAITSSYSLYAETASISNSTTLTQLLVINQTGTTINKGVVVRITGSNNASDIPRIATASYESDGVSANTLGVTSANITNGSQGYVITEGVLTGIDTTGWSSGTLLFLGATGSIIASAPQAPLHAVRLGQVVRQQSNNGSIVIRVDNGYELNELHDVIDNTTDTSYGDLLVKSGSVWVNSRQLTGSYGLTGSLTATSFTGSLRGTSSYATEAGNTSTINISSFGSPVESYLLMSNVVATTGVAIGGDTELRYNSSTNVLTVPNISSTSITGSLLGTASTASFVQNAQTASYVNLAQTASFVQLARTASYYAETDPLFVSKSGSLATTGSNIFTNDQIISGSLTVSGSTTVVGTLNANGFQFIRQYNGNSNFLSGSLSIGKVTANGKLDVSGSAIITGSLNVTSDITSSGLQITGSSTIDLVRITQTGTGNALVVDDETNPDSTPFVIDNAGNVGIGTTSPGTKLDVSGDIRIRYTGSNTNTISQTNGNFGYGKITPFNSNGQFVFDTYATSSIASSGYSFTYSGSSILMFMSSSGNVGIGTTAPNAKLAILGNTNITGSLNVTTGITGSLLGTSSWAQNVVSASFASTASFVNTLNQSVIITGSVSIGTNTIGPVENTLTLGARDSGNEGAQLGFNAPGGTYTSASFIDNYSNFARILRGSNAGSDSLVTQWNLHTKQMQLPAYTAASAFAGTAVANLAVDSSGNVITVSTAGGTVFPYVGNAVITGSLTTTTSVIAQANGTMYFRGGDDAELWDVNVANTVGLYGQQNSTVGSLKLGSNGGIISGWSSSIGIGTVLPNSGTLHVNGNVFATSFTGSLLGTASWSQNAISSSYATTASYVANASSFPYTGSAIITGSLTVTGSVAITQNITGSRLTLSSSNGTISGSTLTVYGSGSSQPVFTIQGSQGELFSVTDSLSGSLFSVNDISGLPILEVFSDNTTLLGSYQDPMLITTTKFVTTASGAFTLYSLPTSSYDTAFFEYSIRSGSNARAGSIMAIQSGSAVNFTETTTTDFGSTSGFAFTVLISGANMLLTGSATTLGWTIKTIIRSI